MGGLLALRLAAHRPRDVCALVTIGVPLELPVVQRRLAQGLAHLRRQPWIGRAVGRFPKGDPDLRSARAREESPSLREFPYPCLASLVDLQAEVVALLPSVRAPLLVLHAQHDHTAPVAHSERLAQLVGSPRVRRVVLPHSFHVVGRDLDRARACAEVTAFAQEVLPAAAPSATP
jgi:carboxylesterase